MYIIGTIIILLFVTGLGFYINIYTNIRPYKYEKSEKERKREKERKQNEESIKSLILINNNIDKIIAINKLCPNYKLMNIITNTFKYNEEIIYCLNDKINSSNLIYKLQKYIINDKVKLFNLISRVYYGTNAGYTNIINNNHIDTVNDFLKDYPDVLQEVKEKIKN